MLNRIPECHAKQLCIDRLVEENRRLKDQLGRLEPQLGVPYAVMVEILHRLGRRAPHPLRFARDIHLDTSPRDRIPGLLAQNGRGAHGHRAYRWR